MKRRLSLTLVALTATTAHAESARKTEIHPYLGVDQTVVADLSGNSNQPTLSYTSVVVGIDAHVENRRSEVQANIAYEHQFSWTRSQPDSDVISGLVQARTTLARGLNLEGGVLATRVRTDGFTGANGSLAGAGSTSNVYSAYVGPTYTSRIGDLTVNAAYRLGYNRIDQGFDQALSSAPNVANFDESWNHYATASIGMQPGVLLPFGWAIGGGYARETQSQLSQRFENKWGRLDLTMPVTTDLAVIGGVGYQSIQISSKDALRDASGQAIRSETGRFVTDENSPRLLAYDNSELIWDVGILWKPSDRTSATFSAGHRYGSEYYAGSFNWRPDRNSAVNISLFDSVDSFGRALNGELANVPTDFVIARNPFSGDIAGCAFSATQGGACFSDTLSGMRVFNYRNRGVSASYTHRAGPWMYGIGLGYSQRKFIANDAILAGVNGRKDQSYFAAATLGYTIDERSGINANLYANKFVSGFDGIADVFNAGGYVTYRRQFARRLQGMASVGIDETHAQGVASVLTALAQIGVRYQF